MFSNNVLLQTLARRCYDNVRALCDVYKFTVKDLPVYRIREVIWYAFSRTL